MRLVLFLSKKSDKGQNGLVVDMAVVIEHGYPVKTLDATGTKICTQ